MSNNTEKEGADSLHRRVRWFPGGRRNKPFEIEAGEVEDYQFSLCRRQEDDDASPFRLFVYRSDACGGGFLHVGGFPSIDAAKAAAEEWRDPYPPNSDYATGG